MRAAEGLAAGWNDGAEGRQGGRRGQAEPDLADVRRGAGGREGDVADAQGLGGNKYDRTSGTTRYQDLGHGDGQPLSKVTDSWPALDNNPIVRIEQNGSGGNHAAGKDGSGKDAGSKNETHDKLIQKYTFLLYAALTSAVKGWAGLSRFRPAFPGDARASCRRIVGPGLLAGDFVL